MKVEEEKKNLSQWSLIEVIDRKKEIPCPICTYDFKVEDLITLECDHRVCKECLEGYLDSKILEN
jgi:uncharacterized protein (DUF2225 family)